jgi:hypothetical protein
MFLPAYKSITNRPQASLGCLRQQHVLSSFLQKHFLPFNAPAISNTLHATRIQIFTMSLSSAPSSLSDSNSSQSDTLLRNEIIVEEHHKDTLLHLADSPSSLLHEDTRSTMPPLHRSRGRDVHIFDASDRDTSIGGLILTAGVTNANLYAMIDIFVILNGEYILRNESDTTIEKNDSLLLPGNYYIDSPRTSLSNKQRFYITNL